MNTPEQNLWKRITRNLSGVHCERFEDMTKSGVPDVQAVVAGRVTWLELKATHAYPARFFTAVLGAKGLNQDQKNWHLTHRKNGGTVCTLIGVGSYDYFLVAGEHSGDVNKWTRWDLEHKSICWGKADIFWTELKTFLSSGKM